MRKKKTRFSSLFFPFILLFLFVFFSSLYFSSPFSFVVRSFARSLAHAEESPTKKKREEKRRRASRVSVESERSEEDAAEDTEDVEDGSTTTKTNGTSLAQKFFKER